MFKDDAELMFKSYEQMMVHLKEKKDDKGLKIFTEAVKNSKTLISGLAEVINELALSDDKELFTRAKGEVEYEKW